MGRYSPPRTPEELAEREQARAAKLEELHTTLAEQVAALRDGQDWQRWLATAARLPDYSLNNVLLIAAQRPQATAVAGFTAWKALGRQVDKGEKGIAILAPIVRRARPGRPGQPSAASRDRPRTPQPAGARPAAGRPLPAARSAASRSPTSSTSARPAARRCRSSPPRRCWPAGPAGLWDALAEQVTRRGFTCCAPTAAGRERA
jgi:hypothetical protein